MLHRISLLEAPAEALPKPRLPKPTACPNTTGLYSSPSSLSSSWAGLATISNLATGFLTAWSLCGLLPSMVLTSFWISSRFIFYLNWNNGKSASKTAVIRNRRTSLKIELLDFRVGPGHLPTTKKRSRRPLNFTFSRCPNIKTWPKHLRTGT